MKPPKAQREAKSSRINHRNFSKNLHKASLEGAVIVCSVAPYDGQAVEYQPRTEHDPFPWVLAGKFTGHLRYSGRECHITWPDKEQ